ncbi:MAG TPA: hypothetical protein PLY36_08365 [Spirochaetota bacterium]|nr:hypothetical protein [Spirochaetota bacterium]
MDEKLLLIKEFFDLTKKLENNKILRSTKYLGDIGEKICKLLFNIRLNDNQREQGFDGYDTNNKKIQIKLNNSKKGTNIYIGNNIEFDFLYLILTKQSYLYSCEKEKNIEYLVYIFEKSELDGNKYIHRELLKTKTPKVYLNDVFQQISM